MGTSFELGKIRQRKKRDGLRLSLAVPKIQWNSIPHCPPTAIRPLETFMVHFDVTDVASFDVAIGM